jgi:hypothetical protein
MFDTSARTLIILAGVIWYGGAIFLLFKGGQLLAEALALRPGSAGPWGIIVVGVIVGSLKARYLFNNVCEKNLQRIENLVRPQIWQFFRIRFFFFLMLMIILGISLSIMAHEQYPLIIWVAALDLSIGMALMSSSYMFWKR